MSPILSLNELCESSVDMCAGVHLYYVIDNGSKRFGVSVDGVTAEDGIKTETEARELRRQYIKNQSIAHTVTIDPQLIVSDMVADYQNGNKNEIIERLQTEHPGIVALFYHTVALYNVLPETSLNEITNRLCDNRMEIVNAHYSASR